MTKPVGTEFSVKKIVPEHIQKHTITEYQNIPSHDKREDTLEFRNAKHELESVEHLGCFICGSMDKRESHHVFERCWSNAFDFVRVANMLFNHYDYHGHVKRDFKNPGELLDWFMEHFNGKYETVYGENSVKLGVIVNCDDNALDTLYNQVILCEQHHRTVGHSAHGSTFATFVGMMAAKPGFHIALSSDEYQEELKKQHEEKHTGKD